MGTYDLNKALLSTQPIIALRDPETNECLVRLSRDVTKDAPSGALLMEVDYLYQVFGVFVSDRFYSLAQTLTPELVVLHLVERLKDECSWELRGAHFGPLSLIKAPEGLFTVWVAEQEVAYGMVFREGADRFDLVFSYDYSPRVMSDLAGWVSARLPAAQVRKPRGISAFLNSTVIDLGDAPLDGIYASIKSARDYSAQYGLVTSLLADYHTIVIRLPAFARLITREFLYELLKDTVGELTYDEYRKRFLFVGFDKYQAILNDVLKQLLPTGVTNVE
jgi:hypothetical protein